MSFSIGFYAKVIVGSFLIGAAIEGFMIYTGFYEIVTRLEAERMEDNIEFYRKQQKMYIEMKRKTIESFIDKGLPIPDNMQKDLKEMEQ